MTGEVLGNPRVAVWPVSLPSGWLQWAVVALTIMAAAPFLICPNPPIADMPNHVARLFLECHREDPILASLYQVRPALIPNISMDLANIALCGLVSPSMVFKGILAASIVTMAIAGAVIQNKAFGAASVGLLVVPATALNLVTFMGYVNFLSGIAVLFVMIALIIGRMENSRRLWLVCGIGSVLLFLCHIFALALGMVFVFGMKIANRRSFKEILRCGASTVLLFSPALALFVAAEKPVGHSTVEVGDKLFAMVVPFLSGAGGLSQSITILVMVIALVGAFIARRRLANNELYCAAMLGVAFGLALPFRIGDAVDIGTRTLAAAIPLFALAIPPRPRSPGTAIIAASCCVLLAFHLQTQATVWPRFSRQVVEFRRALVAIPPKSKILTVWGGADDAPQALIGEAAYSHLAGYGIVDRGAFYPLEFMGRGMQPLSVNPQLETITPRAARPLAVESARSLEHWAGAPNATMVESKVDYGVKWPEQFDRVVYFHFGDPPNFDATHLRLAHEGSYFSILTPVR
jgi:hypothetical protein